MPQFLNDKDVYTKWKSIIECEDLPSIRDTWKRKTLATLLENMVKESGKKSLQEDAPVNNISAGNIGTYNPVMIAMARRAVPQNIAYDVCAVQPLTTSASYIFAMKSRYASQTGTEALFDEANASFSAQSAGGQSGYPWGTNTLTSNFAAAGSIFGYTKGMSTFAGELLGGSGNAFNEMAFSIDKITVTADTRKLKAEYTRELEQDMRAIHGLSAENELANILSTEIVSEVNRDIIRRIYYNAKLGCASGTVQQYVFNLDVDANGRWSVEKFKGLRFQIEREANKINIETRRGRGNFIICSLDVASALEMTGILEYNPQYVESLMVDPSVSTFAGTINGRMKVYVDPYHSESNGYDFCCVGYKGSLPYDAGIFYCPYIPLEMYTAQNPDTFQPKIAFATRYGVAVNPYVSTTNTLVANANTYYRRFGIINLL
jgi:hypothetical protein